MNIVIPSLLRIKLNALNKVGEYLRAADWSEVAVLWGEGLRERFGSTLRVSFDATDTRLLFESDAGSAPLNARYSSRRGQLLALAVAGDNSWAR